MSELPIEGVDVMIDCTGAFKTEGALAPYFDVRVKKVIVSAPVKGGFTVNIVYGVNQGIYNPDRHSIITAASCTINCIAPVVKVIHEELGIKHGSITTIDDVANTRAVVNHSAKDLRRARSALNSLIPTTTGLVTEITLIYPELPEKLNGHAVRPPLLNASLTDCVFEVNRETTASEVNACFKAAAEGELKVILGYEKSCLVSDDYTNDPRSSIIDSPSTMVVNGTQGKI